MKRFAIIIVTLATLVGNSAFAQQNVARPGNQIGKGAQAGTASTSDHFAWGIGLGCLAVLGIMVGVTAGTSSQGASSFSH